MTTMESFSVQSAHGLASAKFDAGRSPGGDAGLGKLLVAFGTIRKVDAGASTFLGSGTGTLDVCSSGPVLNENRFDASWNW
jgi:hypothetical protein